MANPRVYMDISIGDKPAGRMIIELFADTTPRSAHTFRSLCTGKNAGGLHYKGNLFWVVTSIVLKLQPFGSKQDREAVFGVDAKREYLVHKHNGLGVVSMVAPTGPSFAIALTRLPDYDKNPYGSEQVVVGKVVDGLYVVKAIRNSPHSSHAVIVDCGELPEISPSQKMSLHQFKQVISISKERLSNCLKEIADVNKQLIAADTEDVNVQESEQELVEVASDLEHSCNILVDLKAEVGSLEKRQKELLSKTEIEISRVKTKRLFMEMIPTLSYEELEKFENVIKKRKSDWHQ